jgi:hypothetical protein
MKMKLNEKKSKVMVFNFTNDYQFATRLCIGDNLLETVTSTKLLGTIIQSDLKWQENTHILVKKGYQRMMILHKLYEFNVPDEDMVTIYVLFLRSILEQSYRLGKSSKGCMQNHSQMGIKLEYYNTKQTQINLV